MQTFFAAPPGNLKRPPVWPDSCPLDQLKLYVKPVRKNGTQVDWAKQINSSWQFGEDGGYAQLSRFLEKDVEHYDKVPFIYYESTCIIILIINIQFISYIMIAACL